MLVALLAGSATAVAADRSKLPPKGAPMPRRWLPTDKAGWTILKPSADSRLVYVSSSGGNDSTGAVYAPGDAAVGGDPRKPPKAVRAFRSIDAGMARVRDGMADWVLLKRGDTWRDVSISMREGRSPSQPFVLCDYGTAAERPTILGRTARVRFGSPKTGLRHAVLAGLALYCSFLDPASRDYGLAGVKKFERRMARAGVSINGGAARRGGWLLVEDCLMRFTGLSVTHPVDHFVFRRSVVLDKYPPAGHTMGMWGAYASVLMEECVFDHNGWLYQRVAATKGKPGRANMLSHNTYCTGMYNTVFRGNIFLRAASIGNKFTANQGPGSVRDVILDDNLYVDGEIGISMGGNRPAPLRWQRCRIVNNVMLDMGRSRPTGRTLGWYLGATDWDGGTIAGNLLLHQRSKEVRNVRGIRAGGGMAKGQENATGVHCRDLTIRANIIHGLWNARAGLILGLTDRLQRVTVADNHIQLPGDKAVAVRLIGKDLAGVTFSGNTYDVGAEPAEWFEIDGRKIGLAEWVKRSGEKSARAEKVAYPDPERNIQRYMKHIGLKPTREAFIGEVRKQSRHNWRAELTAERINAWFREGFSVKKVAVPRLAD